jgi:hypothetical protein
VNLDTIQWRARKAGLWYLAASLVGIVGLVYVPGKLIVDGDATATAARIRASESLMRIGMASDLLSEAMWVIVVFSLYRLFERVDRHQARLLLILGAIVSVPIMFLNEVYDVAALTLAKGGGFLAPFEPRQLDALAYLCAHLHGAGVTVASFFWGLWLFPFGLLVIRSGFIPRLLGWLLLLAGVAWVTDANAWVLFPEHADAVGNVAAILRKGEALVILWLVIWGARGPLAKTVPASPAPAAA